MVIAVMACDGAGAPVAAEHADDVNAMLTLSAGGGAFADLGNGTYRLTLGAVAPSAGYAAEEPQPASGQTTTRAIIAGYPWDEANPPTAALVMSDPGASSSQNVFLLRLMHPVYDAAASTLVFDVQLDPNYRGQYLASYVADADTALPATFGQAQVVVDSIWHHFTCGKGYISCYLHYGCCSQPFVTHPLGNAKVPKCWSWSAMSCQPCSDDPCAAPFPDQCGHENCYDSCLGEKECTPG